MTKNAKSTRKRKANVPAHLRGATPQQRFLHHIEEAAVHIAAARKVANEALAKSDPRLQTLDLVTPLEKIGRNLRVLYRRAGGNPDATR